LDALDGQEQRAWPAPKVEPECVTCSKPLNARMRAGLDDAYPSANATRGMQVARRTMSLRRLFRLHPEPDDTRVYHGVQHTLRVAGWNSRIAEAYGVGGRDLQLVEMAGLLHDIDPARAPGSPPSVPRTIDWLHANQADLGLTDQETTEVALMIQRTEFPFDQPKPSEPSYGGGTPAETYEQGLQSLPPDRQAFVMENGSRLSNFADQGSYYVEGPDTMGGAVEGLSNEIHVPAGALRKGTPGFLKNVGNPSIDQAMAQRLGVDANFATLADISRLFPDEVQHFRQNIQLIEDENAAAAAEAALAKAEPECPTCTQVEEAPSASDLDATPPTDDVMGPALPLNIEGTPGPYVTPDVLQGAQRVANALHKDIIILGSSQMGVTKLGTPPTLHEDGMPDIDLALGTKGPDPTPDEVQDYLKLGPLGSEQVPRFTDGYPFGMMPSSEAVQKGYVVVKPSE
jgi:hypothetical protein